MVMKLKPKRKYTILILRTSDEKSKSFGIYEHDPVSKLPLLKLATKIEEYLKGEPID